MPAVWAVAHPEVPQRSLDVAAKKLQLPQQDNFCDCGLFLLTYAEFFTHSPARPHPHQVQAAPRPC